MHDPPIYESLPFHVIAIPRDTSIDVGHAPDRVFVIAFLAFVDTSDAFVALRGATVAVWIRSGPDNKPVMVSTLGATPGAPSIIEHTI
jgi:hypothetical protein